MNKNQKIAMFGISLFLMMMGIAHADELPPANAKPLSAVVQSVESQNMGMITGVEYDEGYWELEIYNVGKETKLYLDAITGEIKRQNIDDVDEERPAEGSKPLSEIIGSLENQKLGTITNVEFDDGVWDVEIYLDGAETELRIDPKSGGKI